MAKKVNKTNQVNWVNVPHLPLFVVISIFQPMGRQYFSWHGCFWNVKFAKGRYVWWKCTMFFLFISFYNLLSVVICLLLEEAKCIFMKGWRHEERREEDGSYVASSKHSLLSIHFQICLSRKGIKPQNIITGKTPHPHGAAMFSMGRCCYWYCYSENICIFLFETCIVPKFTSKFELWHLPRFVWSSYCVCI